MAAELLLLLPLLLLFLSNSQNSKPTTTTEKLQTIKMIHKKINTLVKIENGDMQGHIMQDRYGKDFFAFRSIPYGRAPIGTLRFQAPQPALNWRGILNANKDIPKCIQTLNNQMVGQEDCLYLNVYTPSIDMNSSKPVMVYIHGGGYIGGDASIRTYGPAYLITEDVVVVAINYRLGALGFLSLRTAEHHISSNNGLKDQILALQWVKNNIKHFGGNPLQVTIFGHEAGGASVHYHVLSQKSQGLFHRAISMSGTATAPWAFGNQMSAFILANKLGVPTYNYNKMVKRLCYCPVKDIYESQIAANFNPTIVNPIGVPTIESPGPNSFLTDHPYNIIKSGIFNKVPYIMGYNNKDGMLVTKQKLFKLNYDDEMSQYIKPSKTKIISTYVSNFYFHSGIPNNSLDMIDYWTDLWFKYNTVDSVIKQSKFNKNMYLYKFGMDTELNEFNIALQDANIPGASHNDILQYIFNPSYLLTIKPGSIEDNSIIMMVKMWTNFAKFGTPTIGDRNSHTWLPFGNESYYMDIKNNVKLLKYSDNGFSFWDNIHKMYSIFLVE